MTLALLGLAMASSARAHGRSISYSSWTLRETGADVRVRIPRLELTRLGAIGHLPPQSPEIGAYLSEHLRLTRAGQPCVLRGGTSARSAADGWAAHAWQLDCPNVSGADGAITSDILVEAAPSHLHFARVEREDGRVLERVLSSSEPHWEWNAPTSSGTGAAGSSVARYIAIGMEHILTGWDHLAFLVALLLLAGSLGEVIRLVTGFTVAHSVTLALAVLGWVHPHPAAVEAVIGFSVFLVATENSWEIGGHDPRVPRVVVAGLAAMAVAALFGGSLPWLALLGLAVFAACHFGILRSARRPSRWRGALAFAFGLVHGFGFAGILAEMQLPTDRLVPALFGFNVGVELGQMGVVVLAWPALLALQKLRTRGRRLPIPELLSAGIAGVGLYWFVVRTFG